MLKLSWASNIGSRSSNEDNLLFCGGGLREACLPLEHRIDSGKRLLLSDAPLLCALADGLGGEDEGGQAARTALLRLSEAYEEAAPEHTSCCPRSVPSRRKRPQKTLSSVWKKPKLPLLSRKSSSASRLPAGFIRLRRKQPLLSVSITVKAAAPAAVPLRQLS